MLEIVDLGPDVLGYRANGKIERGDVERVFAELDRKLAASGRVLVYAEVVSLSGITHDALWREIQMSLGRMDTLGRIPRAAVVTDAGWIRTAGVLQDRLFSGIEIRTFTLAEAEQARTWIRG